MNQKIIFQMNAMPVQQNRLFDTAGDAIKCPVGDLRLMQDSLTGIVCNDAFRPELMSYDENYQNEQGYSRVFEQHLHEVADIVRRHFSGKSILEVGCGKGRFLDLLKKQGFCITGIDPAYEGNDPDIVRESFSPSLGMTGEAVILRHVLEHIHQPMKFLTSIAEANGGKGLVYIEVPCLEWIRDNRAWYDLFYEHVNYFRRSDFFRLFDRVIDSGTFFGGQYLYVVADIASLRRSPIEDARTFHFPPDFLAGIDRAVTLMRNGKNKKYAIWGGASKGVVFALHLLRRGAILPDLVIDINPFKQRKYMPVTGMLVSSPEEGMSGLTPDDVILVMNSNYFDEIKEISGNRFLYYRVDQNEF